MPVLMETVCGKCTEPCFGDVLEVDGNYFHDDCFYCKACGKSLASFGFFNHKNEFYCADDYNQRFSTYCEGCGNTIDGDAVDAMGQNYHEQCFICYRCRTPFPPGTNVNLDGENFYCDTCLKEMEETPMNIGPVSESNCAGCGNEIKSGQALLALDKQWHLWCFTCNKCGCLLSGEYMGRDGVPFCERDYQSEFGVTCAGCGGYITGKVLQAGEKHYHPQCSRCAKCGQIFGEGEEMYLQGSEIWHPHCSDEYQREMEEANQGLPVPPSGDLYELSVSPTISPPMSPPINEPAPKPVDRYSYQNREPAYRPKPPEEPAYRPKPPEEPAYRPKPPEEPAYRPKLPEEPAYRPKPPEEPVYRPKPPEEPAYRSQSQEELDYRRKSPEDNYRRKSPEETPKIASNDFHGSSDSLNRAAYSAKPFSASKPAASTVSIKFQPKVAPKPAPKPKVGRSTSGDSSPAMSERSTTSSHHSSQWSPRDERKKQPSYEPSHTFNGYPRPSELKRNEPIVNHTAKSASMSSDEGPAPPPPPTRSSSQHWKSRFSPADKPAAKDKPNSQELGEINVTIKLGNQPDSKPNAVVNYIDSASRRVGDGYTVQTAKETRTEPKFTVRSATYSDDAPLPNNLVRRGPRDNEDKKEHRKSMPLFSEEPIMSNHEPMRETTNTAPPRNAIHRRSLPSLEQLVNENDRKQLPIYPYAVLKSSNYKIPKEVDKSQLEAYIADDEFAVVFKMSKEDFYKCPVWRQRDIKKKLSLF